jgi:hypothetical protein
LWTRPGDAQRTIDFRQRVRGVETVDLVSVGVLKFPAQYRLEQLRRELGGRNLDDPRRTDPYPRVGGQEPVDLPHPLGWRRDMGQHDRAYDRAPHRVGGATAALVFGVFVRRFAGTSRAGTTGLVLAIFGLLLVVPGVLVRSAGRARRGWAGARAGQATGHRRNWSRIRGNRARCAGGRHLGGDLHPGLDEHDRSHLRLLGGSGSRGEPDPQPLTVGLRTCRWSGDA